MAAIMPEDLRLLPGDLVIVRYPADATHRERVTLWPIDNQQWVTLSPDGVMHSEQLRHFARVQKITGAGAYSVGDKEVTAFELPLSDAELFKWITDGRRLA